MNGSALAGLEQPKKLQEYTKAETACLSIALCRICRSAVIEVASAKNWFTLSWSPNVNNISSNNTLLIIAFALAWLGFDAHILHTPEDMDRG